MSDKTQAGWYPSGLRLGERQEEVLRQWPLERIRPKSVSLGVRSLFAEVDALREQLAAANERAEAAEAITANIAIALGDAVALIHLSRHDGLPGECERATCVSGKQLVDAARAAAGPDDAQAGGEVDA